MILDALLELNPKLDRAQLQKASKKEVLARAKKAFKKSAWLPAPLRGQSLCELIPEAVAAE